MNENQYLVYAYIEINGDIDAHVLRKIFKLEPRKTYIKGLIGRFGGTICENSVSFSTPKINSAYSSEAIDELIDIVPIGNLKTYLSKIRDASVDVVVVFNYKGSKPAISLKIEQINWLSNIQSSFSVSMYEDLE